MASDTTLLSALEPLIMQNRGARFEADVFSVLLQDPHVVRAFEFAAVDGALDCTEEPSAMPAVSFAERFWELDEQLRESPKSRVLLPFDVKSTTSYIAGEQIYITTIGQRCQVAFYIGICAANPKYVEVIPNAFGSQACEKDDLGRSVAVNVSRKSFLGTSAYGLLDPCSAPYRMPVALLSEAMHRLRKCALGQGDYINPWTHVRFLDWRPRTILSNEPLKPAEQSEHFTAYIGVLEICRAIRNASSIYQIPIAFDFVNLQPRLADFKMIIYQNRQVFVQYKIDGRDRAIDNPLTKVAIARGNSEGCRWYFSTFDRFDFLLYQFNFSNRPNPGTIAELFFIPERCIPDHFYTSLDVQADFSIPAFQDYRIRMDSAGEWVQRVFHIIKHESQPRQPAPRALRSTDLTTATSLLVRESLRAFSRWLPQPQPIRLKRLNALANFHQKFFYTIMTQCALRSSGLLIVLAHNHSMGDFAFCQYRWTQEEQNAYFLSWKPPKTVHELPATTPVIPIYTFARGAESSSRGPTLTSPQFRRVNSSRSYRLLLFDLMGPEGCNILGPLLIIPSNDMSPTSEQLNVYLSNLKRNKHKEFTERVPLVSQLLHSGRAVTDYTVSACGPLLYDEEGNEWSQVWELLDRFSGTRQFEHPLHLSRKPAQYRATIQQVHERLVEDFRREREIEDPPEVAM